MALFCYHHLLVSIICMLSYLGAIVFSEKQTAVDEETASFYSCSLNQKDFCWAVPLDNRVCYQGNCPLTSDWMNSVESQRYNNRISICDTRQAKRVFELRHANVFGYKIRVTCLKNGAIHSGYRHLIADDRWIEVYGKPQTPMCELEILSMSSSQIKMTCTTDKVFPQAGCFFQYRSDNITFSALHGEVTYTDKRLDGSPMYFKSQCTLITTKGALSPGRNYLRVLMYPALKTGTSPNVSSDIYSILIAPGAHGDKVYMWATDKHIEDPVVTISLSVALVVVTAVAVVLAVLLVKQRKKNQKSKIPPTYDRVTPNQCDEAAIYQQPVDNAYFTPIPPDDESRI